jgi:hypothetical protein
VGRPGVRFPELIVGSVERLLIAAVIIAVVAGIALVARRRRDSDPPTQPRRSIPEQLDRADFDDPARPWLVVVFSSATCDVCASVVDKAMVLATSEVAVTEVEFTGQRALHERYSIAAVPTTVVVDATGVTRAAFLGPMTATDLWAAVAEAREPGSTPEPHLGHGDAAG